MITIPHVFDIEQKFQVNDRPWLIVGKGPSFSNIYKLFLEEFWVWGLNHVCEIVNCTVGSCIDIEVLSERFVRNSEYVLLPWHVHSKYKSISDPLSVQLNRNEFLQNAHLNSKLMYVDVSTWKGQHSHKKFVATVRYNSGELPFQVLGKLNVKKIYSVGIDGGIYYNPNFSHLQPLQNGRTSFNDSIKMIEKTCNQYGIKWVRV